MTAPDAAELLAAMEATWPAAAAARHGPWMIRDGQGGGKRVSAATAEGPVGEGDIPAAEAALTDLGQTRLFQVRAGEDDLDRLLDVRGYAVIDPVTLYACPVRPLADQERPRLSAFTMWEPLAIMREIWAEGGIGPARQAVMERADGPKTAVLGRADDKPAGTAFVAVHRDIAMVHALEVRPTSRRRGAARHMMVQAAQWAQAQGAGTLALAVTDANEAANALYRALGMTAAARYHYRLLD
ncbi:GNAT family N-acetyltransferase [Tranquillimonas alkanivorans]|uniref:Acetyltransferase (GNAT) family protein n=1 Tax=Tranquillimonas alkanivorans TaxID=441119 RepID=A0A1I5PH43_9RHOB|nr:GNAT family N-acetyltransferase [Tranquillimonas alkanivorans]SFP33442.1 Acetyltransferase (GNAT) family protein [Tranquillimonas alkanivorans]